MFSDVLLYTQKQLILSRMCCNHPTVSVTFPISIAFIIHMSGGHLMNHFPLLYDSCFFKIKGHNGPSHICINWEIHKKDVVFLVKIRERD